MHLQEVNNGSQIVITIENQPEHSLLVETARPICFEAANLVMDRFMPARWRSVYGIIHGSYADIHYVDGEATYPYEVILRKGQVMKLGRRLYDQSLGNDTLAARFRPNPAGEPIVRYYAMEDIRRHS